MTLRRSVGFVLALIGLALAVSVAALVVLYVMVKRLYVQEALHTPTPLPGEDKS